MLLILTPNPALDRTMLFPGLRLGAVQRTDNVLVAAGGKGLNVARAARSLGQPALLCAPTGGRTGDIVAELAEREGLAGRWVPHAAGETRTCVLLVDPLGGEATALNESGPMFGSDDWLAFAEAARAEAANAALCVLAGSLPRGVDAAALGALLAAIGADGRRVIVDTSGAPLQAAIATRPYGVKVNAGELGAAFGRSIESVAQAATALADLRAAGIALAVVSMGAEGAIAADATGTWWACPPALKTVSSVGCGDSLLAGLAAGLLREYELPEALRLGVACGSADALTVGGGRIVIADLERLGPTVRVERVG